MSHRTSEDAMFGWGRRIAGAAAVFLGVILVGFAITMRSDSVPLAAAGSTHVVRVPGIACDGCGGPSRVTGRLGQVVRLGAGDTLAVTGTPLQLRFLRVSTDSRCPSDVTCVWAGEAILVFSVQGAGEGEGEVAVRLQPGRGVAGLGAYVLIADGLLPVPRTSATIKPEDYEVTVVVEAVAPATGSGIAGLVTAGPVCPVMRADLPCPDRPYPGTLVVSDSGGVERARVTADADADADGRYSLALSPGTYRITPLSPPGAGLTRARPVDVVVPDGWAVVHIVYDSGIR